ncbi:MAG: ATP-grasp fold amidoligase family protein [Eggerthellaceae bacterium]
MSRNYYWHCREWPYREVHPCIFAEEYITPPAGMSFTGTTDYKFYCFNGEPRFLYVSSGLENHATAQISFIELDWKFAPFKRSDYRGFDVLPEKPSTYEEMLRLAKELSFGIPFVRVDFFEYQEIPRFSEMTFYPCGGFMSFEPPEYDYLVGSLLELPAK